MKYKFHIVDVFSSCTFGGNQLAVLPEAEGISPAGMQQIAREFNFAETTFVLPAANASSTCRVRIFTPKAELAFAGHPTIGTACALVMAGRARTGDKLILEEGIGPVVVHAEERDGAFSATFSLSGTIEQQPATLRAEDFAAILSLQPPDVKGAFFASAGLPFCFVHLASRDAVDRATINRPAWTDHLAKAWSPHVFFFAGDVENGAELYARMCAPALGVEEDPATGSACAALVGAFAERQDFSGERFQLSVKQGVAMGRPSEINASADKSNGTVTSVHVGGMTAYVAAGEIDVPSRFLSHQHSEDAR